MRFYDNSLVGYSIRFYGAPSTISIRTLNPRREYDFALMCLCHSGLYYHILSRMAFYIDNFLAIKTNKVHFGANKVGAMNGQNLGKFV